MNLSRNSEKKLRRTIIHIFSGIIIMLLIIFYEQAILLLFFIFIVGIILSVISFSVRIPVICYFLDSCELERNKKFPGKSALFMLAGSLIVAKFLPPNIALASIAILTFADPVSHFASKISKKRYKVKLLNINKNHYGTICGMIVAFLAAIFFIPVKYAIPAAIVSMLAESLFIQIKEDSIDDNLIIPLVAAATILIFSKIF